MGIISIEKMDHLYWLGRYTERVYTTLRKFYDIYDQMIESPEGAYEKYCERLNIPNIYTSNKQFIESYLFDMRNPDSIFANMGRAFDNAIVLRDELSSNVLSYVQLSLDTLGGSAHTTAPLLELQQVIDYLLAFWGCVDDYVEEEECRNILKCGKYIERLDLYIRLDYNRKDIEKEYCKLLKRIKGSYMCYNEKNLECLGRMIEEQADWKSGYQEALGYLGGIIRG